MSARGWLAGLAVVFATAACGPIEYVNHTTLGATPKLDAARAADAEKWSPYWWTRAVQYLHKSKEEAAYAHFQAANRFGELSEEAADKAREEALRRAADPAAAAKEMGPIDGGTIDAPKADDKAPAKPNPKGMVPVEDGS